MTKRRIKIKRDWLSPREAIAELKKNKINTSMPTFMTWVREYKLAEKPQGRWFVFKDRLEKFINTYFNTELRLKK